ncbi:tetratricopeptide repeat protein [Trichocoleus sp. FACHB-591]|uniref:O-linked N-acetylglucosamine transferase, SPINDLY family protein n=1 Tax=Trichocoleus sp. FACHB-591 TaxID=2692872 RepID=UPI00168433E6|nr:tetratricopeptide repeat protein [Trichocoleus sp. FACHB-591]MBD2096641.1 tetratricopeptide repeat protein [Trichocoleus sp. FACHB-591]
MVNISEASAIALQHFQAKRWSEAEQIYRQILQQQPNQVEDQVEALSQLGLIAQQQGQIQAATQYWHQAATQYCQLALACFNRRQLDQAITYYQQALALQPTAPDIHTNLGNVYQDLGQAEAAIASYQKALTLKPDSAEAHNNLGNMYKRQGQLAEASTHYQRAVVLRPDLAETYNNLGNVLKDQGRMTEAIAAYRQAIAMKPGLMEAKSNLLFSLHYDSTHDPETIFAEHKRWAEQYAEPLTQAATPHLNDRTRDRRLRIGYVSPDFNAHPVGFFIGSVLAAHDRANYEVFCYANLLAADGLTEQFRRFADGWRDIISLSDEQVAQLVRQDQIDILVDLAGHTAGNRILVFAHKPAPIQVTYLGYPNTTGLSAIDYRLTDTWADPVGVADTRHTESLVRLPRGFLCYQAAQNAPTVEALPALTKGYVTFGSFNNLAKVTPEVIATWANILKAVPQSQMVLKYKALTDAATRQRFHDLFAQHGVTSDRVHLLGHVSSFAEHLALYHQIDIGLDSFPYNGTTTTCEALWMGIPVITLAGKSHAARVGMSLLANLGLTDLIAVSSGEYVALAKRLAEDRDRLRFLRSNLRYLMSRSPLTNGRGFTQTLESLYRQMWHRWCDAPSKP